jgi:hypothetical protein
MHQAKEEARAQNYNFLPIFIQSGMSNAVSHQMDASAYVHNDHTAREPLNQEGKLLPLKIAAPQPSDEFISIAEINEGLEDDIMNSLLSGWDIDEGVEEFEGNSLSLDGQCNPTPLVDCTPGGDPLYDLYTESFMAPSPSADSMVFTSSESPRYSPYLSQEIRQLQRLSESMRRSEITRAQVIRLREAMISQLGQRFDEQSLQNFSFAVQQGQVLDTQSLQAMTDWLSAQIALTKRQLQSLMNLSYGGLM